MLISLIVFLAVFVQSSIGFGFALVSMPLLVGLLGIQISAPLVAVLAAVAEVFILIRYREALNLRVVWQLIVASIIAIPLGVLALRHLDAAIVTSALGVILIAYALYALFSPRLPELAHRGWAYGFGFVAGLLGGAYNTPGPPVIIFGNCRGWPPDEFKGNLQGFFLVNSLVVVAVHLFSGNYNSEVWQNFLLAIPGLILGLVAGFLLSKRINAELFRKIVLVLLIILGIRLITG
jgi:uncharacterized membrane protein YfcA